jgi:hypothetical protein
LTPEFERGIVPLLRRMINLEKLSLFLSILTINGTYIDGIQLHDRILIYMTQLNKFTFSIHTFVTNGYTQIDLPSNEDIQRSFMGKGTSWFNSSN